MATYKLTTSYYDEPSIIDEYDSLDEAMEAWADANNLYAYAPNDVAGDIRAIVLRSPSGAVLRKHGYA